MAELRYWLQVEPQSEEERRLRWIQELSSLLRRAAGAAPLQRASTVLGRRARAVQGLCELPGRAGVLASGAAAASAGGLRVGAGTTSSRCTLPVPCGRARRTGCRYRAGTPHGASCQKVAVPWTAPEAEVAAAQWLDIYGQLWRKQ